MSNKKQINIITFLILVAISICLIGAAGFHTYTTITEREAPESVTKTATASCLNNAREVGMPLSPKRGLEGVYEVKFGDLLANAESSVNPIEILNYTDVFARASFVLQDCPGFTLETFCYGYSCNGGGSFSIKKTF